jgi:hypothetical protein
MRYWLKYSNPWVKFKKDIRYNTFDDIEVWNLYGHAALFILPRLKHLRASCVGYPAIFESDKEWDDILGQMIEAFEIVLMEDRPYIGEEAKALDAKIENGLALFAKYYMNLWD